MVRRAKKLISALLSQIFTRKCLIAQRMIFSLHFIVTELAFVEFVAKIFLFTDLVGVEKNAWLASKF
jgi:hypothetical protein